MQDAIRTEHDESVPAWKNVDGGMCVRVVVGFMQQVYAQRTSICFLVPFGIIHVVEHREATAKVQILPPVTI